MSFIAVCLLQCFCALITFILYCLILVLVCRINVLIIIFPAAACKHTTTNYIVPTNQYQIILLSDIGIRVQKHVWGHYTATGPDQ